MLIPSNSDTASSASPGPALRVRRVARIQTNLWIWATFLFLVLNILTAELYTSVWSDEVMFTDPAANLYFGRGFTSTAWVFQSENAFWAGNAPLHSLLLCVWFKVFGFGIHQTRIFGYVFWTVAVIALCMAARRFGWITSSRGLALLTVLCFLGQGATFAYRDARYDPLAVLLLTLSLLALSLKRGSARYLATFAICCLFLPAYLSLGPFFVMICLIMLLLYRLKYWRELTVAGTGVLAGWGLLYLFYSHFGVWHEFRRVIVATSTVYYNHGVSEAARLTLTSLLSRKAADTFKVLTADTSSLILVLAIVSIVLLRRRHGERNCHWPLFAFTVFVVIPMGMLLAYAFPIYYWWMRYLPLSLTFVAMVENGGLFARAWPKRAIMALVLSAVSIFGLPVRLLLTSLDLPAHKYEKIETFVRRSVQPEDVVFADYEAFYPLQELHLKAYYPSYLARISPLEARSVNCLLIDPAKLSSLGQKIGGKWQYSGMEYVNKENFGISFLDRLMPQYFKEQTNRKYRLAVYRRNSF